MAASCQTGRSEVSPGIPSDRSPSCRQQARPPLSTGCPGPSWVQPPRPAGACGSRPRFAWHGAIARSAPCHRAAGTADGPASWPGAGLGSNIPSIAMMSTCCSRSPGRPSGHRPAGPVPPCAAAIRLTDSADEGGVAGFGQASAKARSADRACLPGVSSGAPHAPDISISRARALQPHYLARLPGASSSWRSSNDRKSGTSGD